MPLKFLIIQTSFLGDVILATAVVEKLASFYPDASIDMLVRKGNEVILENNPKLRNVLIWNKGDSKYLSLMRITKQVRGMKYDYVVNMHRFGSSGLVTFLSGAAYKIGFHNNPFSFCYTHKLPHIIGSGMHEVERNQQLISFLTDADFAWPKIYPSKQDALKVQGYMNERFVCIAPGSVWATKRLPLDKWVTLCDNTNAVVYILGAPAESVLAKEIISRTSNKRTKDLCTSLTLLQSAALMQKAAMNYVNDSAPLHLCTALAAPCTAFFCSTVPEFGFGPMGADTKVIQTNMQLSCKPCGIHGRKECPEGHFKCGNTIDMTELNYV